MGGELQKLKLSESDPGPEKEEGKKKKKVNWGGRVNLFPKDTCTPKKQKKTSRKRASKKQSQTKN